MRRKELVEGHAGQTRRGDLPAQQNRNPARSIMIMDPKAAFDAVQRSVLPLPRELKRAPVRGEVELAHVPWGVSACAHAGEWK
jgi:hypothetical protein